MKRFIKNPLIGIFFTLFFAGIIWFLISLLLIVFMFGDYIPSPLLELSGVLSLALSALIVRFIIQKNK